MANNIEFISLEIKWWNKVKGNYTDKPTKPQLKTLIDVKKRSKGLPVGIPVNKSMAKRLVEKGFAECAPPFWKYPKPVFTIRLTTLGDLYASGM